MTSNFLVKTQLSSPGRQIETFKRNPDFRAVSPAAVTLDERMIDLNEFKDWLLSLTMDEIRTPKDFVAEFPLIFPTRL